MIRKFVVTLATEVNAFLPWPVDCAVFERASSAPRGTHAATSTVCSTAVVNVVRTIL